ncbi:MAG: hypothetical protein MI807_14005 [Verrucomicrobiales bacterium]|nr:hypothetical protein [Verrucomicrobiales bacterium]
MKPSEDKTGKRKPWLFRLGVGLILLSGVCFFTMLSVPFFPLGDGQKAMLGGGLFIGMQISWWVGAACVGPAAVKKMSSWFKRSKKEDLSSDE